MNGNLCRVCLNDEATIPIFDSEVKEYKDIPSKFLLCLGEEIPDKPEYPRSICEKCYILLDNTVSFINKYKESCLTLEKKFKEIIKEEQICSNECLDANEIDIPCDNLYDNDDIKSESTKFGEELETTSVTPLNLDKSKVILHSNEKKQRNKKTIKHILNSAPKLSGKLALLSRKGDLSIKFPSIPPKLKTKKSIVKKPVKKLNSQSSNTKKRTKKETEEKTPSKQKKKGVKLSDKPSVVMCEHCGKSFKKKYNLQLHIMLNHLEKKDIECSECRRKYNSQYALSRHKRRMHGKKIKLCSECGKSFPDQSNLEKHYNAVHLKIRSYKMHPCKFCGKEYITAKSLLVHERSVHTGERPAICTICDARFVHDEYLAQHMRLHTGETPFKCPVCARGYAQSGNMKSHIKHNHRVSQLDALTLKTIHPRYLKFMKP